MCSPIHHFLLYPSIVSRIILGLDLFLWCNLLSSVASASRRILGRLHVAVSLGVLSGGLAKHLLDGAVFVAFAHPLLQVTVKLAAGDTAFPAVDLSLDAHLLHGAILVAASLMAMDKRAGPSPCPLHVVGSRVAAGERNSSVQSSMDFVKVGVCESEANAVDGVEVVKDGVVKLCGEVQQCVILWWLGLSLRNGLVVHDRVRAAGRRQLGPTRKLGRFVLDRSFRLLMLLVLVLVMLVMLVVVVFRGREGPIFRNRRLPVNLRRARLSGLRGVMVALVVGH